MSVPLLKAIEAVLMATGKALSAREIAQEVQNADGNTLGGATPWKTVGARLASDIRYNPNSAFMRVGRGAYALKGWTDLIPITVAARKINPLEEDILAIDAEEFNLFKKRVSGSSALYPIHYSELLARARVYARVEAELRDDIVQLIPSFIVFRRSEVLTFKRTKKTPEQRLHDSYSIMFGGHLQADDLPGLFLGNTKYEQDFLFRELREELLFTPEYQDAQYLGVLHLTDSRFERQHAGVVFAIELGMGTKVRSMEPGFHSSLSFISWIDVQTSPIMNDSWSAACITHIIQGGK